MWIKLILLITGLTTIITISGRETSPEPYYDPFSALISLHTYPMNEGDIGKEHKWIWIQTERFYVKFSLKACHSAHIGMATHPGNASSLHYEVVFGEATHGIKDLRTGDYLVENQGNILDCNNYKPFWISWGNQSIAVGQGTNLGADILMDQTTPDAATTRAVSFTTGEMQDGYWQVHKDMGRLITITNPPPTMDHLPDYDYLWISFEEEPFIVFQVKMCTEARINISPNIRDTTNSYEIRIGTSGNTKTSAHEHASGDIITEVETMNILSCNQYVFFWISRQNDYIELGVSSKVGDNRILYFKSDRTLMSLGFATVDLQGGMWQFRHITGEYYSVPTTYDNRQFTEVMTTTRQTHLEVMVQGCQGAIIVLHTANTQLRNNEYLLVIGDQDNKKTTLQQRQGTEGYILWKIVDTPYILNCDVSMPFWVSWKDNTIRFGQGYWHINSSVLDWTPTNDTLSPLQSVILSTDDKHNRAEWRVNIDSVSTLVRRTNGFPTFNQLWYDVTDTSQFVFDVRVCADAFVKLTEYHGVTDYHTYELQMGVLGDTQVNLLKDSSKVAGTAMTQPLACSYQTQYWIEFYKMNNNNTRIAFGNGPYPGENTVLEYLDTTGYDVNAISIATGEGKIGDWVFSSVEDNNLVIMTDPVPEYKYGYLAVSNFWFTFSIQACSHTCFIVSGNTDYNNMDNSVSLEFCLGVSENINSTIKDMSTGHVTTVSTPNLLSCSSWRHFWFEWDNQNVIVGVGDLFNNPILKYTGDNNVNIRFVQFSTSQLTSALIKVPEESYGLINLRTSGSNAVPVKEAVQTRTLLSGHRPSVYAPDYQTYWLTSVTKQYLVFSVVACQEVYVALAPLYRGKHTIEVRIGVDNNTMTEIYAFDISRKTITEQVLSCTERRDFWITWTQDDVNVGTGRVPGDNRLVSHKEPGGNYAVHAVSMSTAKDYEGTWDIASMDVDNYLLRSQKAQVNPIEIHTRKHQFFFTLMVESNAEIRLHKNNFDYYRIELGGDNGESIKLYKRANEIASGGNIRLVGWGIKQKFWLSWENNTINMGTGHTLYKQSFILWIDGDTADRFMDQIVQVILSSNKADTSGYWAFPKHSGNATIYHSPQNDDFYGLRIMSRQVSEMVFRVKTCNQALIALSDIPGIITERTYELVIEDGRTTLRDSVGGNELVSSTTLGGLLDCNHYRPYWISWKDYTIKLGAGNSVGNDRFLIYYLPDHSRTVNELAMGTGESTGSWEFSPLAGNLYHIHTTRVFDPSYLHSQMWYSNPKTWIQFAVKAEKDARIALSYKPRKNANSTYELIIGDNNNQETVLYFFTAAGAVNQNQRVSSPNILDKNNYRTFWISWDNLKITVGAGQLYSGLLLTMTNSMMFQIYSLSFASGTEVYGDWSLLQDEDDSLLVQTREYFEAPDFSMTVSHRTYFIFQVKSCKNAEILLAGEFGNEDEAYQIIIGGDHNQKSYIKLRPGSNIGVDLDTSGILNCDAYKTFWVSWNDGTIKFGKGSMADMDTVLVWTDTSDNPQDVVQAFLNTGNEDIGHWELIDLDGESFTVHTSESHTYDYVRVVPVKQHIMFKVQACRDAHVGLITETGGVERVHFEIVLGCCGNMKTLIRNESLTYNVAKQDTPEILSCTQLRTFWISWENGLVQVGFGLGERHLIVEYQDSAAFTVKHISFSTYDTVAGKFKFTEKQVSDVSLTSRDLGAYSYAQFWRTVMGKTYFAFRVQAPTDVQLILTTVPNVFETDAYELKIGTEGNKKTELIKKQGDVVTVDSDGILSDTEMRDFWIQFTDTHVMFGKGTVVGENTVVSMEDHEYNINAISITTASGIEAKWEFPQDFTVPDTTTSTTGTGGTGATTTVGGPTTTTPIPTAGAPNDGLSAGAIVGITFGVLGFLMIAALGVILFVRLRQLRHYKEFDDDTAVIPTDSVNWDNPNYEGDIQLNNDPFSTGGNARRTGGANY